MNWLHSAVQGFVNGVCQMIPVSAEANLGLLRQLMGAAPEGRLFDLLCRVAVLIVLLTSGCLELHRLRRTARILRMPARRRTGHPSLNESGTLRLLRMAAPLALIGGMLSTTLADSAEKLWLVSTPLVLGGVLLWLPTHMRSANKDGRHLTGLDGILMGLGALCAAVPGISAVGAVFAIASMRGTQRRYALRLTWMLLTVRLLGAMGMDLLAIIAAGFSFGTAELLGAVLGGAAAAAGAWLAIQAVRGLTRPGAAGLFGFCYYNWGQALLSMILFLVV